MITGRHVRLDDGCVMRFKCAVPDCHRVVDLPFDEDGNLPDLAEGQHVMIGDGAWVCGEHDQDVVLSTCDRILRESST